MIAFALALWAATLDQPPETRPPELVITPSRIVLGPGPVLRAASLAGAPPLPPSGIAITYRCDLGRIGLLANCQRQDGPAEWEQYARRRLTGYRIGPTSLRSVPVALTIVLAPEDRRDLTLTGEIHPDTTQLEFVRRATARQQIASYPSRARLGEVSASLILACRVTEDHSLFCPEVQVRELSEERPADRSYVEQSFIFAAQQVMGVTRVAPALKNGRPSAGHQFRMEMRFIMN